MSSHPSAFVNALPVHDPNLKRTTISQRRPRKMRPTCGPLKILNGRGASRSSLRTEPPSLPEDADLSAELKKRIQYLYAAHVTASGVDYQGMKSSPEFAAYAQYTRLLPRLNLDTTFPDDTHKIAFFVNLYNALTQHAVIALGPPPAASALRLFFGMAVGYTVGPYRFSLNDIENGILRKNKGVSILPRPFGKFDARRSLCVQKVDPRIHFVLNCAANSCPPVLFLTPENLERTLVGATKGFLRQNFRTEGGKVQLSRIFEWYMDDFGGSQQSILEFVKNNADESMPEVKELERIMNAGKVKVEWLHYDWSLNSI